jgi:outer membrane biosynthesis protein TonB
MSRPSFIGILLLTCGLLLMAGLVLWHHERLNQLDQQVMQLRLEKKLLRTGPVPTEPETPVIQSFPEPPPVPRQRQRVEPAKQVEKPLQTELVPTEPETPVIQSFPEPAPVLRQRQTVEPSERDETLRRLANSAIDEECQRRGLSTDTLRETWRCVGTPPEGKK